jgi:hypothetical protein
MLAELSAVFFRIQNVAALLSRCAQIWQVGFLIVHRPFNEILPLITNGLLTLPTRTSTFLKVLPLGATSQG